MLIQSLGWSLEQLVHYADAGSLWTFGGADGDSSSFFSSVFSTHILVKCAFFQQKSIFAFSVFSDFESISRVPHFRLSCPVSRAAAFQLFRSRVFGLPAISRLVFLLRFGIGIAEALWSAALRETVERLCDNSAVAARRFRENGHFEFVARALLLDELVRKRARQQFHSASKSQTGEKSLVAARQEKIVVVAKASDRRAAGRRLCFAAFVLDARCRRFRHYSGERAFQEKDCTF